jgi:hypothetical protein
MILEWLRKLFRPREIAFDPHSYTFDLRDKLQATAQNKAGVELTTGANNYYEITVTREKKPILKIVIDGNKLYETFRIDARKINMRYTQQKEFAARCIQELKKALEADTEATVEEHQLFLYKRILISLRDARGVKADPKPVRDGAHTRHIITAKKNGSMLFIIELAFHKNPPIIFTTPDDIIPLPNTPEGTAGLLRLVEDTIEE